VRIAVVALTTVLALATPACAGESTIGVNLTALTGRTSTSNGMTTGLPFGPIPTIELRTASGIVRAQTEFTPGVSAPVDFYSNPTNTRLAGGTGSIDARIAGSLRASLGILRRVQTETHDTRASFEVRRATLIASGPTYGFALVRHRVWTDAEFSFAVAPRVWGSFTQRLVATPVESYDPLRGSQVDIRANVSGRRRLGTPVVGVRYFNFGAASTRTNDLVARSAGLFLTFGLRATVGG